MRKRMLPNSDVAVSSLGLGTATWGFPGMEDDSIAQLRAFADAGGTLIDTAHVYGKGGSELVIGKTLEQFLNRDDFVLATKCGVVPGKHPMALDASRPRMLDQLDESLRRLRVEYIDLWQVHAWDDNAPVEETLGAIDTAITAGKVRAGGVCNYTSRQFKAAMAVPGVATSSVATLQVEYSLAERHVEAKVVPAALESGVGILPWAPLGRGVLTGKYLPGIPEEKKESRFFGWYVKDYATSEGNAVIAREVVRCAEELGVSPAAVALSWVRDRPGVIAPLVGARSAAQLAESLSSASLELPGEIRRRLDSVSAKPVESDPAPVAG